MVRSLARRIAAEVPTGRAIGVVLPTTVWVPVAILASLAAGRTCLLFNYHQPPERLASVVRGASVFAIVHDAAGDAVAALPEGITRIPINAVPSETDATEWSPSDDLGPDAPAVVVYTSGSTGQQKGVVQSQRGILCRARQMINAWHMHGDDRLFSLSIPNTIAGLTCCVAGLATGAGQIVVDLLRDSVLRALQLAQRERATIMVGFPDLLRGIVGLSRARDLLSGLRIVRTTGGGLLRADVDVWRSVLPPGCHLMTTFGATETMTFAQRFVPSRPEDMTHLPVGYPLPDHAFMVVDEENNPVPVGEVGELVVRSRNIGIGEWQDGRCVPGRFRRDGGDSGPCIVYSGDLVRWRTDGLIAFVGRRDDQVKVRGQRLDLAEIEGVLRDAAGVADVAVAAERQTEDVILHGFIAGNAAAPQDRATRLEHLHTCLTQMLPPYMVPLTLDFVAQIPRLASGKVDRLRLLAEAGFCGE